MVTEAQRKALIEVARLSSSTAHRVAIEGVLEKADVRLPTLEGLIRHGLIHVAGSRLVTSYFGYRVTAVGWDFIEQEILKGV